MPVRPFPGVLQESEALGECGVNVQEAACLLGDRRGGVQPGWGRKGTCPQPVQSSPVHHTELYWVKGRALQAEAK